MPTVRHFKRLPHKANTTRTFDATSCRKSLWCAKEKTLLDRGRDLASGRSEVRPWL